MPGMRQRWETITFIHWPYPIESVQALLPPPFEVQPWEGRAWVGLLPFFMRVYPPLGPRLAGFAFPETNVRTYVRGPDGRVGIWFFSLDAASPPVVATGRLVYGLPYFPATMRVRQADGCVHYTSRRLVPAGPRHDIVVAPLESVPEDGVDRFDLYLTARFLLWTTHLGAIASVPAEHPPWRLRRARLERMEENLLEAAGLPRPGSSPVAHYSEGVDVRLGHLERYGGSAHRTPIGSRRRRTATGTRWR
jgi:uncharacterized protein